MALSVGTRLGSYEILTPIGAGGMGEVYRARDAKLGRDVALKILPAVFASDPDRLARFEREARVLAALDHPNIGQIFGLEESNGTRALVLALIEGPTLADRIAQGPLPGDEARNIALQIAEAFEYAHDRGVIHRDLKPANIKITPEGTVKVLDFGLAKALEAEAAPGALGPNSPTMLPTVTLGATQPGMILGTAAYISPEQVKGKQADRRSDIWAFGVVLYEMLTGERPFQADSIGELMAEIVKEELKLEVVPVRFRTLVARCLTKEPRRRLQSFGEGRQILEDPEGAMRGFGAGASEASVSTPSPSRFRAASWILAGAMAAGLAAVAFVHFRETPPVQPSLRLQMTLPGNLRANALALSPDGRFLAFQSGSPNGPGQLWVRSMETGEAKPVSGAEGVSYLFWSPDSADIGFFSQGKLKRVAAAGGPPQTLCDVADPRGGTWNRDGVILFSPGPTSALFRVSAAGGTPQAVTKVEAPAEGHRFPAFLPDGKHFLFASNADKPERTGIYIGSLDGEPPVRLLPDNSNAVFAASPAKPAEGHILFGRSDALMALPFDAAHLRASGDVFPIAEQIGGAMNGGHLLFSASGSGLVIFSTGSVGNRQSIFVDRNGKRSGTVIKGIAPNDPGRFSPDGNVLAVGVVKSLREGDLWLMDLTRGTNTRFTFRSGRARNPVWSPDGSRIAYAYAPTGRDNVYEVVTKAVTGASKEETLIVGIAAWPNDWSPDGKFILYEQTNQKTALDLMLLPVDGSGGTRAPKPIPYAQGTFDEREGRFSPDGKWIAYMSNESGQYHIYLQSFPPTGAKYDVSAGEGSYPAWRRDGKELYYLGAQGKVMAVPVRLGASMELGTPQVLFADTSITSFAAAPDGQRFLVNVPAGDESASALLTVITNWEAGLKK